MRAKVTLGGRVGRGVYVKSVIRAGLHAGLAADAAVGVKVHHAVVTLVQRRDGTNGNARRPLAVIAAHHREQAAIVGKSALLDVFDPRAVNADGNLMLAFASDGAGMATNALAVIDHEAVGRHALENLSQKT
jgi:hypothetical protein